MEAKEIPNLAERLQVLERVLAHVLGLLARDPATLADLQGMRAGYLVGMAKHARPGPFHPQQEEIAEALHKAWSDLFKNVPHPPPQE